MCRDKIINLMNCINYFGRPNMRTLIDLCKDMEIDSEDLYEYIEEMVMRGITIDTEEPISALLELIYEKSIIGGKWLLSKGDSYYEILRLLLDNYRYKQADANYIDSINHNILDAALRTFQKHINRCYDKGITIDDMTLDIFELLDEYEMTSGLNDKNYFGYTILHDLVAGKFVDKIQIDLLNFFIDCGADLNLGTGIGENALDLSVYGGNDELNIEKIRIIFENSGGGDIEKAFYIYCQRQQYGGENVEIPLKMIDLFIANGLQTGNREIRNLLLEYNNIKNIDEVLERLELL